MDIPLITTTEAQIVRWSVWFSVSWLAYVLLTSLIKILPALVVSSAIATVGYCSESVRRHLEYIPALKVPLVWVVWQIVALVTFRLLFWQLDKVDSWKTAFMYIKSASIFAGIYLAQRILIQNIAVSFNQVAYNDRVIQSKRALAILQRLKKSIKGYGIIINLIDYFDSDSSDSDHSIDDMMTSSTADTNSTLMQNEAMKENTEASARKRVPAKPESSLRTIESQEKMDSTIDIAERPSHSPKEKKKKKKQKQKQVQSAKDMRKVGWTDIRGDKYAESLGQKLFKSLCNQPNHKELHLHDFKKYFATESQATEVFQLFDLNRDGSVYESDLILVIKQIYQEKKALSHSLSDLSMALENLNKILTVFSVLLGLISSLPVFGISLTEIIPYTSILVALSFIFSGSAKTTFEGIIFLFVIHPYDTGDRIFFDDVHYLVEELNLLTTTLFVDGRIIYIPNHVMAQKTILNARRSKDMADYIKIRVSNNTSKETLRELEKMLLDFVSSKPRKYFPKLVVTILEIDTMTTVRLKCFFKGNWQDINRRWAQRTAIMHEINRCAKVLSINFELPLQKIAMIEEQ